MDEGPQHSQAELGNGSSPDQQPAGQRLGLPAVRQHSLCPWGHAGPRPRPAVGDGDATVGAGGWGVGETAGSGVAVESVRVVGLTLPALQSPGAGRPARPLERDASQ